MTKSYFPGLNGLRVFATLSVLITHIELTKKLLRHPGPHWVLPDRHVTNNFFYSITQGGPSGKLSWASPFVTFCGYTALMCFFVLSGFLITYLLLEEKKTNGTVSIKKFYMRRILRIWPAYFLTVFLGFFVLTEIDWTRVLVQEDTFYNNFWSSFVCYMLIIPNLAFALFGEGTPNLGHLWSIGVEEQFYLIWPVLIGFFKRPFRSIVVFFFTVLAFKAGLYLLVRVILDLPEPNPDLMQFSSVDILLDFVATLKFECVALGGIAACIVFYEKEKWLKILYNPAVQWLSYLSLPLIVLFTPKSLFVLLHLFLSLPFVVIVINVGCNEKSIFKLRSPIYDRLGKITYGAYLYHLICFTFVFHALDFIIGFPKQMLWWQSALQYIVSISFTVLVASLSYKYIEYPFMRKKRNFTTVISGEDART